MKKKVVFVADDFGQTDGINRAVIESFEKGIVRSASIVINGAYAEDAIAYAKSHRDLDTGIHLALVYEKPVSSESVYSSLINPKTKRFYDNRYTLFLKVIIGQISLADIKTELDAQIQLLKSKGISCTFVNSHDHIHFFPPIFKIVIKLCKKHNITFVRIPNETIKLNYQMLKSGEFWRGIFGNRNIARIILRFIYLLFFRRYEFTSVKKTDYFKGILYNCVMTVESLMNIITSIKPGITEVICHPAYDEAEYKKLNHYKYMKNYKRERELKSLCNPDIYKLVEKYDIKITSYKDLTQ